MKKKSRFLVHIALIALSLCIMVYGVYAAKQASLTVSGTIGFTAHGVNLRVSDLKVAKALDANGAAYTMATEGQNYTGTTMSTTDVSKIEIVNPMYFDNLNYSTKDGDNIPAIEISFKVYNLSRFAVQLTPVSEEKTVTLTKKNADDTGAVSTEVKYTASAVYENTAVSMAASADGSNVATGGTCIVTIKLVLGTGYTNGAAADFALGTFALDIAFAQVTA